MIARFAIRIKARRRLYIDDAFIAFALVCLCATTALVYRFAELLYGNEASKLDPTFVITIERILGLTSSLPVIDSFLALAWTTTFSIKFSFLALFRLLIGGTHHKLRTYFWFVVAFTSLTWMFLVSETFILCPYFGFDSSKSRVRMVDRTSSGKKSLESDLLQSNALRKRLTS